MKLKVCVVCTALAFSSAAFAENRESANDAFVTTNMVTNVSQTMTYGNVSDYEARTVLNYDPYEKYNRWMDGVNDTVDRNVFVPVARGYRKAVPGVVRTGARNFFNNLRDVWSFGSNVLRLDIKRASEDLVRVGLNTGFGLGGLIDIAGAAQMPNNKNGLGDTFASWGWKNSHYFVLPLGGPSTVRDGVATTIALAFPIDEMLIHDRGYRYTSFIWFAVDLRESVLDLTDSLEMAAMDPYSYKRDVFMNMRAKQIGLDIPAADDVDIDDLVVEDSNISLQSEPETTAQDAVAVDAVSAIEATKLVAIDFAKLDVEAVLPPVTLMDNVDSHIMMASNTHEFVVGK